MEEATEVWILIESKGYGYEDFRGVFTSKEKAVEAAVKWAERNGIKKIEISEFCDVFSVRIDFPELPPSYGGYMTASKWVLDMLDEDHEEWDNDGEQYV